MKISSVMNTVASLFGKSASLLSHLNTASDLLGALRGHQPSETAHPLAKGFHGMMGWVDEQTLEALINQLEKRWRSKKGRNKGPNAREVLAGFFAWHFKHGNVQERVLTWWYGNAFRTFVTKMVATVGVVEGTEERVIESKEPITGTAIKTVMKKELRTAPIDDGLNFLQMMVDVICSEPEQEAEPKRLLGYQKLLAQFEAFRYPHIPADTVGATEKVVEAVFTKATEFGLATRDSYQEMNAGIKEHADRLEQENDERKAGRKSLLDRLISGPTKPTKTRGGDR